MAETVTIALGDGTEVRAEVVGQVPFQNPDGSGAFSDVGIRSRAAAAGSAVTLTLDGVRDTVRAVGRWAAETVTEGGAAGAPDSFEVEFGLKLAVKSGQLLGVIAEAGAEAGLTVKLSWDLAARRAAATGGSGTDPTGSADPAGSTGTP
ncbi:CU044_2847 family protein [Streptomyces sp. NPDC004031]